MTALKASFPPIVGGHPRVLILGSMPGEASLRRQQYYGHPRNAFWPIMSALLGLPTAADYQQRTQALVDHGIALWDVIGECERDGSLDAAIRPASVRANAIAALLARHPSIVLIAFNGGTAEREYRRRIDAGRGAHGLAVTTRRLPSTSPAYAAMPFADKLSAWRAGLADAIVTNAHGATPPRTRAALDCSGARDNIQGQA